MPHHVHLNTRTERIVRKHDAAAAWLAVHDAERVGVAA